MSGPKKPITAEHAPNFSISELSAPDDLREALALDIVEGFKQTPKTIPPKYFYDVDGSGIFDKITDLPEYYVARSEVEALEVATLELATRGLWTQLIELGAGNSRKTGLLLDTLLEGDGGVVYSPLDISSAALLEGGLELAPQYPDVEIQAFVGDFLSKDLDTAMNHSPHDGRLLAFFGTTLGNMAPEERKSLFSRLSQQFTSEDALLVGVDLIKDKSIVEPAYNDSAGITAEFNKNVLRVMNRELGANVDPRHFDHFAPYIESTACIEMRLYANRNIIMHFEHAELPDHEISVDEYILTELSKKYTEEMLVAEIEPNGLESRGWWTDSKGYVGLMLIGASKSD